MKTIGIANEYLFFFFILLGRHSICSSASLAFPLLTRIDNHQLQDNDIPKIRKLGRDLLVHRSDPQRMSRCAGATWSSDRSTSGAQYTVFFYSIWTTNTNKGLSPSSSWDYPSHNNNNNYYYYHYYYYLRYRIDIVDMDLDIVVHN